MVQHRHIHHHRSLSSLYPNHRLRWHLPMSHSYHICHSSSVSFLLFCSYWLNQDTKWVIKSSLYGLYKTVVLKGWNKSLSATLPDLWITDFRKYHFPFWDPSGEGNAIIPFSNTASTLSFFPSILRILSLQLYLIVLKLSLTSDSEFDSTTTSPIFKVPKDGIA